MMYFRPNRLMDTMLLSNCVVVSQVTFIIQMFFYEGVRDVVCARPRQSPKSISLSKVGAHCVPVHRQMHLRPRDVTLRTNTDLGAGRPRTNFSQGTSRRSGRRPKGRAAPSYNEYSFCGVVAEADKAHAIRRHTCRGCRCTCAPERSRHRPRTRTQRGGESIYG